MKRLRKIRLFVLSLSVLTFSSCIKNPDIIPIPIIEENLDHLDQVKNLSEEMLSIPLGQFPLYLLGDVNLDEQIDELDANLIRNYLNLPPDSLIAGSCKGAADLNDDGLISEEDEILFNEIFAGGDIYGYPIVANPTLACDLEHPLFAARLDAYPGDSIPIRLIGTKYKFSEIDFYIEGEYRDIEYLPGEKTWNIHLWDFASPDSSVFIDIHVGTSLHYYFTVPIYTAIETPQDTNISVGIEELTPPDCPQRGDGCEALVIDFLYNLSLTPDIRSLPASLSRVGCSTTYVKPKFVKVPQPWTIGKGSFSYTHYPDPIEVARKLTQNKLEWARVRSAIATYKNSIIAGKELSFQTVAAHGSSGSATSCGTWGPGFYTGDWMFRSVFNAGNYYAAKGNVCGQIMHDISCYSGQTPKNFSVLNNIGSSNCTGTALQNRTHHAAYEFDMATAPGYADEKVHYVNIPIWRNTIRRFIDDEYVSNNRKPTNEFKDLIGRFKNGLLLRDEAVYTDRGYHDCTPHVHETAGY